MPCTGDLNYDNQVNGADLGVLLGQWATSGGTTGADINADGTVNGADLGRILGAWGPCPIPATAQSCLGDLNADRTVTGADLGILLGQWGQAGSGDLNGDGIVGGADLGLLLGVWGACPVTVPSWATLLEAQPDAAVVTDAALRAAISASGRPWRVRDTATQMEMLLVPPGTFMMGCTACGGDESPAHEVTLTQAFYMGRYEVTQSQWVAKMGSNPSYFQGAHYPDAANRPVEQVNRYTVLNYLGATSMRLPSEAEWEYACRAGTTTAFNNGSSNDSTVGEIAWWGNNSGNQTHAVGGKAANALGLFDMSGNVWEWVNDFYGQYSSGAQTNPTGPGIGNNYVLRGGGWHSYSDDIRSSYRGENSGSLTYYSLGFRVARNP
jgi:formylglycine-generating enzyme required for sulfatase activity